LIFGEQVDREEPAGLELLVKGRSFVYAYQNERRIERQRRKSADGYAVQPAVAAPGGDD
jgi:hypothetical protein